MKHIQIKKEDIKEYLKQRKERNQQRMEERKNSAFTQKMEPVYFWMNRLSLLLHFLWAVVLNFVIESISRHSVVPAWEYMITSPWAFLFNTYMIFITFLLVYLIRRRVFLRIIISVLWLVLGCVNGYMLTVRVTPFVAQDFKVVGDALSMIDKYFTVPQMILLIILIVAILTWLVSMFRRGGIYTGKMYRIPAIIAVLVTFGTFGWVTDFAIEQRVLSNYFGNIAFAYQDYGLPYCFSATLFRTGISQPSGYNEDSIAQITNNGKLTKTETSRKEMPNIILIQLESFFDSDEAEFFTTSKDPIPTFHSLMKNYSSGYFKVPSVGAGTANTEFEVLTGMNLRYFGPGEYPYKTIAKVQPMETVATALKGLGYGAHALHNNDGDFYSRADVFNQMGFDTYTSKEFMNVLQYTENGWAKDEIMTEHILNALDSTEQQDFVFGISVEGHGDYPEEKVIENPEITVSGIEDEGTKNAWEYYVNHLYETDKFIAELVARLEQRNEPTVLILYGDHLPTMGLQAKDLKSRYLFNTNYVMWDNMGLKKQDRNIPTYQLVASLFEKLDIHAGTVFNYHQTRRKTQHYFADLELLQYDMLYGRRYVYGGVENAPSVDGSFRMGIKDVGLTGVGFDPDGNYTFYGQNMTPDSKIFINGTKHKTIFINNTRIELEEYELQEGDQIVINQVSAANRTRIFRSSQAYQYSQGALIPIM